MNKKALIITLILISTTSILIATPSWYTNNYVNQFSGYFIGKGFSEIKNGNEAASEKRAIQMALSDAASTISCSVSGKTINRISEEGSGTQTQVEDYFLNETKIKTDLEVMNYTVLDKAVEDNIFYAMIGLPLKDIKKIYRYEIERGINKIAQSFQLAEQIASSNPNEAIKKYEQCIAYIQDITEDMKIYLFLNNWQNDLENRMKALPARNTIEEKLITLVGMTPKSTIILADELLESVIARMKNNSSFIIYPFEWQNTGFVSEFGNTFSEIVANKLNTAKNCKRLNIKDFAAADYVIRGKLINSDAGLYIFLTVKNISNNSEMSNQIFVNKVTCNNIGWDKIKPKDLDKALQDKLALYESIQSDNSLKVELQTEKMSDGPVVYYFDEEPQLLVKSNKVCYVRLIYIFSDGLKTLLVDNYFIPTDKTNQWVKLPFDFIVCEPAGIEQMLMQASTEKMPDLYVKRVPIDENSHIDVIETGLAEQIAKTRGIKIKNPEKEITERVYQWTVFEK
ncbi:MAG: hypothetical protein RAP70_06460 [Candidatus Celaenobacter antarcticus]|nr:hypothetical protein [Candidatus Celaenobacter antarcticus]MDP8314699.1 hypothetical protein [Candidatus Celaenobacter antarcticus]